MQYSPSSPLLQFHEPIVSCATAEFFKLLDHSCAVSGFPFGFCGAVNIGFFNHKVQSALLKGYNVVLGDDSDFSEIFRAPAAVVRLDVVKNIDERPIFLVVKRGFCGICKAFFKNVGRSTVIMAFVRAA